DMLRGFAAPTALGVDRPPAHGSAPAATGSRQTRIAAHTTERLQVFGREHGLTLNTMVQGAWAVLLGCYSGDVDVVFGVTVSGRPPALAGVERMVGLFINTLPLRVAVAPGALLAPWLHQIQQRLVELRLYEHCALAQIQAISELPPGLSLFESIV